MVSQSLSHFRVLRMGRAESQILVTHSHLTHFGWSGELNHNLHLVTLPIVIRKLVNWLAKKLYGISRLSCYDQYFLLRHSEQLRPTFWLILTNFLFWVYQRSVNLGRKDIRMYSVNGYSIGVGTGGQGGHHAPPPKIWRGGGNMVLPPPNICHFLGKLVPKYHGSCKSFVKKVIASGDFAPWTPIKI